MKGKKSPAMKGNRRRKRSPEEEEEEEEIPLVEIMRRMKRKRIMKEEEDVIPELRYETSDGSSCDDKLSSEDEEEEKKHICRSPVDIFDDLDDYFYFSPEEEEEEESESDEELFTESNRIELDRGCKYVLRKRWRAITNPKVAKKTYYKSYDSDIYPIIPVLHDPKYPLATISKMALDVYNAIQATHYQYLGLVKAYMKLMGGFRYTLRFKALLPGQDAINFQSDVFAGIRHRKINVVPVRVDSVYPLPPC